jgi:hypothetical protein
MGCTCKHDLPQPFDPHCPVHGGETNQAQSFTAEQFRDRAEVIERANPRPSNGTLLDIAMLRFAASLLEQGEGKAEDDGLRAVRERITAALWSGNEANTHLTAAEIYHTALVEVRALLSSQKGS